MDSKRHFLISVAVGLAIVAIADVPAALPSVPYPTVAVVAYAGILGVAIDFDHFLASRLHCGDWRATKRCLANPTMVFTDESAIFDADDLWPRQRLLSHVVIIGLFVPGVYFLGSPFLGVVAAVVLYAHVLADLIEDNRNHETNLRKAARVVEREERGNRETRTRA